MKLVDTSVIVDIDREGVDDRVAKLGDEGRHGISAVTRTELRLDVEKQYAPGTDAHRDAVEALDRLCARFDPFEVTRPVAVAAAEIIAQLQRGGAPLDDLHDVYIAATAKTEQVPA